MNKFLRRKKYITGTSLAVQWLKLHASAAGDTGSIPDQLLRSCRPRGAWKKRNKTYIPCILKQTFGNIYIVYLNIKNNMSRIVVVGLYLYTFFIFLAVSFANTLLLTYFWIYCFQYDLFFFFIKLPQSFPIDSSLEPTIFSTEKLFFRWWDSW